MRGVKQARMGSGRRNKGNLGEVFKDLMLEAEECMIGIEGDLSWDIYVLCYVSIYYISTY